MNLTYQIEEVNKISEELKAQMFSLLEKHYANVSYAEFLKDLHEKQWAIELFLPDTTQLVGFSTQMLINIHPQICDNCMVLYSGDTIIAQEYWGSMALPLAFLQLVSKLNEQHPNKTIFWLLISKGLRTYRFLSVFLNEYYPNPLKKTPFNIQKMMDAIATSKFGEKYEIDKGIIKANQDSQYLKDDFQPQEKKDNPIARFFYSKNPGYAKGDELVCLAEISELNLHPFIKRVALQHGHKF